MTAFKEGDWVRSIVDCNHARRDVAYKVCTLDDDGVYIVVPGTYDHFMYDREVEKWTPKVGERVRVVRHVNSYGSEIGMDLPIGSIHTVKRVGDALGDIARPSFTLSGGGIHFYLVENLEPVTEEPLPVAAEAQPVAQAAPAPLTIQAGKFYKTRDGRKVGPMLVYINNKSEWMIEVGDGNLWTAEGKHKQGCRTSRGEDFMHDGGDIIAEWPSDATNVAATVDALDEEYGPVATVADVPVAKPKFKVGDRVRVVKVGFSGHRRSIGEEFTLSQLMPGNSTYGAFWTTSDGPDFYLDEIELVARPTPAIVCLIDNSSPLPATRPRVHTSIEAADKEAARLAGVHKGQKFGVFAMTGTPHKVEKTYEHEWQRLAAGGRKDAAYSEFAKSAGIRLPMARRVVLEWLGEAA